MRPAPADRRDLARPAADPGALHRAPVPLRAPNTTDPNEPMALTDLAYTHDPVALTPDHSLADDGGEDG